MACVRGEKDGAKLACEIAQVLQQQPARRRRGHIRPLGLGKRYIVERSPRSPQLLEDVSVTAQLLARSWLDSATEPCREESLAAEGRRLHAHVHGESRGAAARASAATATAYAWRHLHRHRLGAMMGTRLGSHWLAVWRALGPLAAMTAAL